MKHVTLDTEQKLEAWNRAHPNEHRSFGDPVLADRNECFVCWQPADNHCPDIHNDESKRLFGR